MLNQVVIVGRIKSFIKREKEEDNINILETIISVPRYYKNESGEYESDFVEVMIYGTVADKTFENCKEGDIIGVKGKIEGKLNNDGSYTQKIIGEKITFLSSMKEEK